MTMKVAVIGAGAAGLVALRHLTSRPDRFTAVAYEMTSSVGGTWVYNENTGTDQYGQPIQSSMYKNLRTNLPKEIMAFPDFPFKKEWPSFLKHEQVLEYLEDYTRHFNLTEHIKFNTMVENVKPLKPESGGTRWQVKVRYLPQVGSSEDNIFDAVIIGNGHYAIPLLPDLAGLDKFQGQIMHSHEYRHPQDFTDKTVLCLGAASSGQDISLELSSHAKQVYLAHRNKPIESALPERLQQTCGVKEVLEHGVLLEDGTQLNLDVLLFCTGYKYHFPFLDKTCNLSTKGERVYPLYKHLIHAEHPTLSVIGVCKKICPFPQFHCQVLFTLAAWEGSMKLPSESEMKMDIERDYQQRLATGMPHRYAHTMDATNQWQYNNMLATMAGHPPLPNVLEKIYKFIHESRAKDLPNYKAINIELIGDEDFRVT